MTDTFTYAETKEAFSFVSMDGLTSVEIKKESLPEFARCVNEALGYRNSYKGRCCECMAEVYLFTCYRNLRGNLCTNCI